jgi:hypothetical protein
MNVPSDALALIDGLLPIPYGARLAKLEEIRVKQGRNFTQRIPSFLPEQLSVWPRIGKVVLSWRYIN